MANAGVVRPRPRDPELYLQIVVVIGGSAGIGLETARRARVEGAEVILTGRRAERLQQAAWALDAVGTAAFDATDPAALARFFDSLAAPVDHVMVTASDPPPPPVDVARAAAGKVRPPGSLIFLGTTRRRPRRADGVDSTAPATPTQIANLAVELAPVRVNLVARGFVDTPGSALLGDELEARRSQLRRTLPIGRLVVPADVAALAVHLMINTAVTGAIYDIDGGQQLVE
jgi:NAD(P)-dependent dehydrogenase (short-subunit alcohol dehydrogenase family)